MLSLSYWGSSQFLIYVSAENESNQLMASRGVMRSKAKAIGSINVGRDGASLLRRNSFRFAPHFLNGVEIRRISRQEEPLGADPLN